MLQERLTNGDQDFLAILVTDEVAVQTPRSIKDLCRDCEDLFNKKGETWVIGHVAGDDKFLVYDALKKSKPIAADHEIAVYVGSQIPEIDVDSSFISR